MGDHAAKLFSQDQALAQRLVPSLLDRLTDAKPSVVDESRWDRVITLDQYKRNIERDIERLMQSRSSPEAELKAYPRVARSVLNYGIPGVRGEAGQQAQLNQTLVRLREAIQWFEPRLVRQTIRVGETAQAGSSTGSHVFEVRGLLRPPYPIPDELFIETRIDLEGESIKPLP